jgi:hypothetical protein
MPEEAQVVAPQRVDQDHDDVVPRDARGAGAHADPLRTWQPRSGQDPVQGQEERHCHQPDAPRGAPRGPGPRLSPAAARQGAREEDTGGHRGREDGGRREFPAPGTDRGQDRRGAHPVGHHGRQLQAQPHAQRQARENAFGGAPSRGARAHHRDQREQRVEVRAVEQGHEAGREVGLGQPHLEHPGRDRGGQRQQEAQTQRPPAPVHRVLHPRASTVKPMRTSSYDIRPAQANAPGA